MAGLAAVEAAAVAARGAERIGPRHALRWAVLAGCAWILAAPLQAQTDVPTRMLLRQADITGLPAIRFDLDARSPQRYALVIGNADYDHAEDLANARKDAADMAALLRSRGYIVAEHHDLAKEEFEGALRALLHETQVGAEVLLFYAGHGVQIGNRNYLIPTDAQIRSVYDVPFMTVSLGSLLSIVSTRSRSLVAILDSCRDNPFEGQRGHVGLDGTPARLRTGFSAQETPINSYVVFSTSPGAVAFDGTEENSPFTGALLAAAARNPQGTLETIVKDVRRSVYDATDQLQIPWESSSLVEPISFAADGPPAAAVTRAPRTGQAGVGELTIRSILNPEIAIGGVLSDALGGTGSRLMSTPSGGRIEIVRGGRKMALEAGDTLEPDEAGTAVYRASATGMAASATRGLSLVPIADRFEMESGGGRQSVSLELEVHDCDAAAGDHLDPQGVGQVRFANEIMPEQARAQCEAAVAEHPDNGRFHYQLGRAHMALLDLDAAEAAFIRAQELGHIRAIQARGVIEVARVKATGGLETGRAPDRALGFFAAGVERGDPNYHSLGRQLLLYPTSPEEERQGFELLSRSLELGHTFSMNALGLYFLEEDGAHYNAERGLRYLRESYARSDIYGAANLGVVAANGLGGQPEYPQRALDLFREASEGGHPTAPSSIGRLYNAGDVGGAPDHAEAVRWYDIGLERGDSWGGANGSWIIANRSPDGYDLGDAAVRAAKSATLRDPEAAAAAETVLPSLPARAVESGTQKLMNALGQSVAVDGAFGPASVAALEALGDEHGRSFSDDPLARLRELARLHWELSPFRVDLY